MDEELAKRAAPPSAAHGALLEFSCIVYDEQFLGCGPAPSVRKANCFIVGYPKNEQEAREMAERWDAQPKAYQAPGLGEYRRSCMHFLTPAKLAARENPFTNAGPCCIQ